jgi:hypothetical protein
MTEQTPHRQATNPPNRRSLAIALLGFGALYVGCNWYATQIVARVFRYAPALPGRLFGHVYQPFAWLSWSTDWPHGIVKFNGYSLGLDSIWHRCEQVAFYPAIVSFALAALIYLSLKRRRVMDVHGSASWGDTDEINRMGL